MEKWFNMYDVKDEKEKRSRAIDHDVQYIENYAQMQIAIKNNQRIYKVMEFCDKLIKEMNEITQQLKKDNIDTIVEYRKGNYRININGKYYYRKVSI